MQRRDLQCRNLFPFCLLYTKIFTCYINEQTKASEINVIKLSFVIINSNQEREREREILECLFVWALLYSSSYCEWRWMYITYMHESCEEVKNCCEGKKWKAILSGKVENNDARMKSGCKWMNWGWRWICN